MSEVKDNPQPVPTPVDITTAAAETKAWRDFMATLPQVDQVNAYFIPIEDITNILQYATNGIRTYFAIRNDAQGANAQVHLYVVPVDANGDDVLFHGPAAQPQSLIYDTTLPCPTACGTANPLNSSMPIS